MKKNIKPFLILLGFLFLLGCGKEEKAARQEPQFTDMKSYIEYKCTMCHFSDRIFQKKRKPEEWKKIVHRMRARNEKFITAEDEQKLVDYFIAEKSLPEEGATDTGDE